MKWNHEYLFNKAAFFISQGDESENYSVVKPLFYCFSLELLSKSALSFISPTLVVDPLDEGQSLMYSLDLRNRNQPNALPVHSIYKRMHQLIPDFLDYHMFFCEYFSHIRNEEIHTGYSPISDLAYEKWLPLYYTIADILCKHLGRQLSDLIGENNLEKANQLIKQHEIEINGFVSEKINNSKLSFLEKSKEKQEELTTRTKVFVQSKLATDTSYTICPSCDSFALLKGIQINQFSPSHDGKHFFSSTKYKTQKLECIACGLRLNNEKEIQLANIEENFINEEFLDLHNFYQPEFDVDYMNM